MLKLMYITNRPEIAQIAETAGVDRIFVDMEYIGKTERQGGMDTVQSHHTVEDVARIRGAIGKAELMVRCNPIHRATSEYSSSAEEIDGIVKNGADIIMLPYFKSATEVKTFIDLVGGRARTLPLVETPEAVESIEEILDLPGVDEIYIGLNDLSLGYHKKFMFELLADGTVEKLCFKFRQKGIPYGFGGIASVGKGLLPAEKVIREHYRLGSTSAILSRSFCDVNKINHMGIISETFIDGIRKIREVEEECERHSTFFIRNEQEVEEKVRQISISDGD